MEKLLDKVKGIHLRGGQIPPEKYTPYLQKKIEGNTSYVVDQDCIDCGDCDCSDCPI